ncbi:MAG: RNB domain-containing ribonuclease [Deltaproteobacteria bacterium]|nr:MAG: RNB domain-containing ribonuclease [Deltaproteobacteria bacterium]
MTDLPFVTIDYDQSRDLDQAVFAARRGGGFEVVYAIADAAWFAPPDGPVFADALARGASFYLPGLMIPMLPRELCEDLASLREGVDRRALAFCMRVDADGRALATDVRRARVRSRRKLTYDGVQRHYDEGILGGQDYTETLDVVREVGVRRRALADARDVVRYDRLELVLDLTGDGRHVRIRGARRNRAQQVNEELSLLCNVEGARLLAGKPAVFRVHPPPPAEALDGLCAAIEELIAVRRLDPAVWRWRRAEGESLADYVDRLPDGDRLSDALQRQAMLIAEPARYSTRPGPHWGIGAAAYARLSAPMREIVGIVNELALVGPPAPATLVDRAVDAGNRARDLQRQLDKDAHRVALDWLFERDRARPLGQRPVRTGTVMGAKATKLYVRLDEPPIEVKVYGDYRVDGRFEVVAGRRRIRVGDEVAVVVADRRADDRWVLQLA